LPEVGAVGRENLLVVGVISLFVIELLAPVATGDERTFDRRTPVVKVYQDTHEAVVNISGERPLSRSAWGGFDFPDTLDLWGRRFRTRVTVQ